MDSQIQFEDKLDVELQLPGKIERLTLPRHLIDGVDNQVMRM